jgi:16S rRNA C1402 (ribose-2'-O) methylase RsmI
VKAVPGACALVAALSSSGLQSFARETSGRRATAAKKASSSSSSVDGMIGGEAG